MSWRFQWWLKTRTIGKCQILLCCIVLSGKWSMASSSIFIIMNLWPRRPKKMVRFLELCFFSCWRIFFGPGYKPMKVCVIGSEYQIPDIKIREWVWSRANPYRQPDLVEPVKVGWKVPTVQRLWFGWGFCCYIALSSLVFTSSKFSLKNFSLAEVPWMIKNVAWEHSCHAWGLIERSCSIPAMFLSISLFSPVFSGFSFVLFVFPIPQVDEAK